MKRLLKFILPIAILALAIAIFSMLKASKPQIPPKAAKERSWTVNAITAQPAAVAPQIELYAEVETPKMVTLKSPIAADVASVVAKEGARVKAGELLIQLDTRDLDLQIAQQRAQIAALKAQLSAENLRFETDQKALEIEREMAKIATRSRQRQLDLSDRKLASKEQLDNAEMNAQQRQLSIVAREQSIADHPNRVAQLKASIAQAQATLDKSLLDRDRASVKAPFDGRITSVAVATGDRLRLSDALARIYPYSDLEVRAQLPAKTLPLIKRDAEGDLELVATAKVDNQLLKLELQRLGAEVTKGATGVDGLFHFSESNYIPEPGRTLSISLELPAIDSVVALPPAALYGTDRIYRVMDSRLESITVEHLGNRQSESGEHLVLVRSDKIVNNDLIITTQLPNAVSGMLVEVKQ